MSNFDGITYAKGAASLKQLHFYVGEKAFRDGIRNYFKRYQWTNTIREQFIGSIAEAGKMNLTYWTKKWLQTAGPNSIWPEWKCEEGKITDFTIIQQPSSSGNLSPHKTQIVLYDYKDGELNPSKKAELRFSDTKNPVTLLAGADCPELFRW